MKIEIDWSSSYQARMVIDGKAMTIELRPGLTRIEGLTGAEMEDTIGGRVAAALYAVVADCMQAQAAATGVYDPLEDDQHCTAWSYVSPEAIDAFNERAP